jgi:hypothetical protein
MRERLRTKWTFLFVAARESTPTFRWFEVRRTDQRIMKSLFLGLNWEEEGEVEAEENRKDQT